MEHHVYGKRVDDGDNIYQVAGRGRNTNFALLFI